MQYRTRRGDALDWIVWKHYGAQSGLVEAVLNANPGLADHGNILPEGLLIALPERPPKPTKTPLRLWD